jgi:hypothetical protein
MYRLTGTGHRAQVHADFHEMGVESTFFFALGADPWNTVITPWHHEFHKLMGNGNATLFNEMFRLYFTKKNFDLFYPSYGDTWAITLVPEKSNRKIKHFIETDLTNMICLSYLLLK